MERNTTQSNTVSLMDLNTAQSEISSELSCLPFLQVDVTILYEALLIAGSDGIDNGVDLPSNSSCPDITTPCSA